MIETLTNAINNQKFNINGSLVTHLKGWGNNSYKGERSPTWDERKSTKELGETRKKKKPGEHRE